MELMFYYGREVNVIIFFFFGEEVDNYIMNIIVCVFDKFGFVIIVSF